MEPIAIMQEQARHCQVSVTAVIVLYKRAAEQAESFTSLQRSYVVARSSDLSLSILLYDNTPGGQDTGDLPDGVAYVAAPQNKGLAAAYNYAIECAMQNGSQWLLTLDQDTDLPEDFLLRMGSVAAEVSGTPAIGAVVPQIFGAGRVLSPNRFIGGALPSWFPQGFRGVTSQPTYAFNSAALIRLSALRQVGGYSAWFWLDNSDACLFRRLHRHGKQVFVAGDVQVQHDFSMMDMRNRVSARRYRNVLLAESAFWDLEMNRAAGFERTLRLVVRFIKHLHRKDPNELRSITQEFLKRRLFWSRGRRLRAWEGETTRLFPELKCAAPYFAAGRLPESVVETRTPRVSVCMAAYNSAPYIALQLRSILQQLGPEDEVIVVDDASTDATPNLIRAIGSPAIRLVEHKENKGVVATFEEALRNATGDILFLADGDDVWAENKVKLFLEAFRDYPEANLVTSQIAFIDKDGARIQDTMYSNRKTFQRGFWHNLLRNHFQGSAMAIRASLLGSVLPFPRGVGFLHDHWIGTRNARLGGSAVYLKEPLLFYRRHGHNLSRRMSRLQQLRVRLELVLAHLAASIRELV